MAEQPNSMSNYKSTRSLTTAKDLTSRVEEYQRGRLVLENQWKINLSFYKGRQYTYFNKVSNRIETLPTEEGEKPRYRVRLISNQIMPGCQSLLAKYTKTKPVMYATPGSSSDQDIKSAEMAERLLEMWWVEFHLDTVLKDALLWGIIAGQGYWKIYWDEQKGKQMKFTLDPMGNPITDQSLKDAYTAEMARYQLQPETMVVPMGDICVEALSPFQVIIDPKVKVFEQAKEAYCIHHMDPDEIYSRYGVEVSPDAVPAEPDVTIPYDNQESAWKKTTKKVYVGYFCPSPAMPDGRVVTWCDKEILQDDPWYYPFEELPLIKFPGVRVPGSVYDSSVVEHAIPLQKELNRTLSQIVEYKNLTLKPRVWAPYGSLSTRITDEPGVVYEYNPQFGMKPEPERLMELPQYTFELLSNISNRMDNIFSIQDVTEGTVPPNVEAGIAIDLLQEMATDRIAPTIQEIENSIAHAGNIMIKLAQQYYIEPRLLKIYGSGGGVQAMRFTQADLRGSLEVVVEAGSGLPRTRAGRQARILHYIQLGLIEPHMAYRHMDNADLKYINAKFKIDEDHAYREHDKLNHGQPINPEAVENAIMAIQAGINPETNEFLTAVDDLNGIIQRAANAPHIMDNPQVHADIHGQFMKSPEFETMPPDIKQNFYVHYQLTQQQIMSVPQPAEPPKVTMQLKSAVGPTLQSKILEKAGVPATPAESAEPPIETWVSNSVDKPDVDDRPGRPDQFTKLGKELYRAIIDATKSGSSQQGPNPKKGIKTS